MSIVQDTVDWFTSGDQWTGDEGIPHRVLEHLQYSGLAFLITVVIALPAGLVLGHVRGRRAARLMGFLTLGSANAARALPTLGLLILAVLLTSGGLVPTLIPLIVLAIPPVLVNAYAGVQQVEAQLRDAAAGMGLTGRQVLWKVELPVALPLILLGLRTAAIQIVSTATIAAYVGLGGLGRFIIDGLKQQEYGSSTGGAILVIGLAFLIQVIFTGIYRLSVSPGLRQPD